MKTLILILLFALTAPAQYVLELDGTRHHHVDHGPFWELYQSNEIKSVNRGYLANDFAWEAWIKINPATQLGYVISAGYGGAHAILLGVYLDGNTEKYGLTGNFTVTTNGQCSGFNWVNFASAGTMEPNTWYHVAVASEGTILRLYKNGQIILTTSWSGYRIASACPDTDVSGGSLYVGGSDHLNFSGRIGAVRGWEGFTPYGINPFEPEVAFRETWGNSNGQILSCVFLADYTQKALMPADLSNGYKGIKHPGHLHSAMFGLERRRAMPTGLPLPQYVIDADYPAFASQ